MFAVFANSSLIRCHLQALGNRTQDLIRLVTGNSCLPEVLADSFCCLHAVFEVLSPFNLQINQSLGRHTVLGFEVSLEA